MYNLTILFKRGGRLWRGHSDYESYEEAVTNFRCLKSEFKSLSLTSDFEYGIINYSVDGITLKNEVFYAKG